MIALRHGTPKSSPRVSDVSDVRSVSLGLGCRSLFAVENGTRSSSATEAAATWSLALPGGVVMDGGKPKVCPLGPVLLVGFLL